MSEPQCSEIRDAFRRGLIPSGAALEKHLKNCERCRDLLAGGGSLGLSLGRLPRASSGDLSTLRRSVVDNALREVGVRAWLRSRSRWQRIGLAFLVILALCSLVVVRGRPDLWSAGPLTIWGAAALYLTGVAAGVSELMVRPGNPNEGRSRSWLALAVSLLPMVVLGSAGAGAMHETAAHAALWRPALSCFLYGSLFTGAFLAWLWVLGRSDRVSVPLALLMATCAGLFGNLALHLHCPSNEPWHLLLGHVAILPVWALAYARWARASSAKPSVQRL